MANHIKTPFFNSLTVLLLAVTITTVSSVPIIGGLEGNESGEAVQEVKPDEMDTPSGASMKPKPTCPEIYEDCIANITLKISSDPYSEADFETAVLQTVKCTELYLQCRKEMKENRNGSNKPENSIFSITINREIENELD